MNRIADWMVAMLRQYGMLDQDVAAFGIVEQFGEKYTYFNENGNLAIRRDVLAAFRKVTERTVVWDRGYRSWRPREALDDPIRRQAD